MKWIVLAMIVLLPIVAEAQSSSKAVAQGATFDFLDADVKSVLSSLAEAAGLNISFGALPAKQVTLRTSKAMDQNEVRSLLRSIAESNGLKLIEEGSLVRVVAQEVEKPAPLPQPTRSASRPLEDDIHVYRLRHIPASRAAGVLQSLLGASVSMSSAKTSPSTLSDQLRSQRIPPVFSQTPTTPSFDLPQDAPASAGNNLFIVAEELSNSLLVRGTAEEWERVQRTIQLIDIRPLQVMIDVLIAEVRRSDNHSLGTSINLPPQGLKNGGTIEGTSGSTSVGDFALSILQVGSIKADVALSAISANSDISILSRPVILAQNNTQARILVGSQRPFIQVVRALPTETSVRDQIIQYRDVGTSVTLTPTINPDGYVNLVLSQEISTATSELQFGAPVISTREASTTLLVRDGQTAVIGGLIDRQQDRTRSGIPILKDIPLIGFLFGGRSKNKFATELFLFLTPHVIKTDDDVDRIRKEVEQSTEFLKKALPKIPPFLVPDTLPPKKGGGDVSH